MNEQTRKHLEMAAILICGIVGLTLAVLVPPPLAAVGVGIAMLPVAIGICQALCWNE